MPLPSTHTVVPPADLAQEIGLLARRARQASRIVARQPADARQAALHAMAAAVRASQSAILSANARDLAAAESARPEVMPQAMPGALPEALIDRLRLTPARIADLATAIDEIAAMPDIIGRVDREEIRPNGLRVARVRIPLGVICMIYESRPNVTSDAAALCIRSGNAVILRGGSEAFHSNQALGQAVRQGLEAAGLPIDAVQVVSSPERAAVRCLLARDRDIDLVIPRGGEGLIRFVTENTRIPVIKHDKGVCHLYVHAAADLAMALAVAENGKAQRPGVCNAVETVLIDRAVADRFVPLLCRRFAEIGVEIRGDERVRALAAASQHAVVPASDADWDTEYLALIVSVRVVDDIAQAIAHIEQHGSQHTEAIITGDPAAAERFTREIDSATVVVNASTRFADGGQLGLGAEIGISTSKLHAYGPMGAEGLTTTRFVVRGNGQIRT